MKRSTRILLFILLFLAALSALFFLRKGASPSTMQRWDLQFKVEDAASIQKIFIADRQNNQTTLVRSGDGWIYNGKYPANPNVMKNLLEAVTKVELQYIPPSAATKPMVDDLATRGVKVEIYGKKDKLLKAYYVGGTTADGRGTFMIMEGAENPYVAQIPHMVGAINVRYMVKGDQWRDKTVFRMKPSEIAYVSIEYPKHKNKSFILEKQGGEYTVRPFYEVTSRITAPYKKGSAEAYLQGYERIIAEAFENDNPNREDFQQRVPFSVITVRTDAGEEQTLRLHPAISSNRFLDAPPPEYEHYLIELKPGDDFILMQNLIIERLHWGYDFFFLTD